MKKLMSYVVLTSIVIGFLGATSLHAQEWTKAQKEVWKVVELSWQKMQEGDFDAAFATVHKKYQGWNMTTPLPTNKEKWFNSYDKMKDYFKLDYYDIEPARITVYENVAVVHYYYEQNITFTKDGAKKEYNYKGKNADFYIFEDGKWLLIGDMTLWDKEK